MAWEQFDATDYENAAISFSQISCGAGEQGLYAYFEGLLWRTQENYMKSIGAFYRVVRRYPTVVEVQTGIPWKPMAFAEYVSYAADMGKPEDIRNIINRYGRESYAEDRVRWLRSSPVPGEPAEVREYTILPADARVEDVGTYQLARAYAVQGDVGKMKEILQPVASEIYGTIMKDGKVVSLRREVQDLLMRYDPPFTRFMNGIGGVILVLLLLEAIFFGPALYRKYWVNRKRK